MEEVPRKKAIIVGCGLVGSMMAHFLLRRGFQVEIYEKRSDFRQTKQVEGRSINLAMSERARKTLRAVGLEEGILKRAVPMKGRLLHFNGANSKSIAYDPIGKQCLYSVSRNELNLYLMDSLTPYDSLYSLHFDCKLVNVNSEEGMATFQKPNKETFTKKADLVVAADGAFSAIRQEIQKRQILNFSQAYIDHGYMELSINREDGLTMVPNHLHIWPRGEFMMIALPNFDNSWTVTLFMPFNIFESLNSPEKLIKFFRETFCDFLDNYCSEEILIRDFFEKKPMPLISIKCKPYNFGRVVLIGDAAHAMVPFYGQGMNAGFQDCLILDKALDEFEIPQALSKFSQWRQEDGHVICDLAMYNYLEMRHLVATCKFRARKLFDNCVYKLMPNIWLPLYNSVSFSDLGYKKCLENRTWQDKVIRTMSFGLITVLIAILLFFAQNR